MSEKWSTIHSTKDELLNLMKTVCEKMKQFRQSETSSKAHYSRIGKTESRRLLIFDIYLILLKLFKISERMVTIEGSQTNLRCLLVIAKILSDWFQQNIVRMPSLQFEEQFEQIFISKNMTQTDVEIKLPTTMISEAQKKVYQEHLEVKRSCQEQKAFRESFFKSNTDFDIDFDDAEAEEETKLLSIEEAILIIQKLERKYQAISRRNYVRFVRERAAELQGLKTEIDPAQAALRIQARTRGYFARKNVREMRNKELEVLNMKPESFIKSRCDQRKLFRKNQNRFKVEQVDNYPTNIEAAIESLKNHFFLATEEEIEELKIKKLKNTGDAKFLDACFRGIVAPQPNIQFNELISQKENVKIDGNSFRIDVRSFITLTICIPLGLNSWKNIATPVRWILLIGGHNSGKTAWARAIAKVCSITHLHISKNAVHLGKRRIYSVVKKLAKQGIRLLVTIDKIDILQKEEKSKGFNHRQLLLQTFLTDLEQFSSTTTVIGMSRLENFDHFSLREKFPIQINFSNPQEIAKYDLIIDCLSRNMEQDRLPKVPTRIFDIEKQTRGLSYGNASKFVINRWSAAANKTNLSMSNITKNNF